MTSSGPAGAPGMLTKFETASNRVKGLSFHPRRPWILASLHNGVIQLLDYRIRTLIDRFDEHDGPVRGVCFHSTQPLFVSGGDDYKIKVWNYKLRRCLFTLLGHLDYIRTVQFHNEYPWILSASDDQTIRIWNWQNRSSVALLTGHNHYVMCAQFHPKEDLVASASLDQTVRVWDIAGLRKKSIAPSGGGLPGGGGPGGSGPESALQLGQADLFGSTDAVVKYVLEGHDRGVNWAAFHPTQPLLVSGADDRQVKLWRMNDTKAWEVDTLRGHFNNVSCALFHPRADLILSNSEDHTIRVWDMGKRTGVQTFRREHDRFWVLAAHPDNNLFAAGHDTGLVIFKLERERPPFVCAGNQVVLFIKERTLRAFDLTTGREQALIGVRRGQSPLGLGLVRQLSWNAAERMLLVTHESEGQYELYQVSKDARGTEAPEGKRGPGLAAVFVARNRFAVLERQSQLVVRDLKNEVTKRVALPLAGADMLFPAPAGCVLIRGEANRIVLYDAQQRRVLSELVAPCLVRSAIYANSDKNSNVALLGKEAVVIANARLEPLCVVHETMRVKSGAFDEHGVLVYGTATHLKYALPNGDTGVVRTLDVPVYLTAVRGTKVFCIDREGRNRVIAIDNTEYLFKLALVRRRYDDVLRMVKESNLMGAAIISYLEKKGFPEVALHFVKEERLRLKLALECGNIGVALEAARVLDDKEAWHRLGVEALRQGNHQVVEMAYQRTKNFERLSFLYLITGNIEKLRKMLKIAEVRQDVHGRFHNALYLGDVAERVRVLEEAGPTLLPLAYAAAQLHGLADRAAELKSKLSPTQLAEVENSLRTWAAEAPATLLAPPLPALRLPESNWPLLNVAKGYFDGPAHGHDSAFGLPAEAEGGGDSSAWGGDLDEGGDKKAPGVAAATAGAASGDVEEPGGGWGDSLTLDAGGAGAAPEGDGAAGGGWGELSLGADEETPAAKKAAAAVESFAVAPPAGPSMTQVWTRSSRTAADHVAAGSVESAMQLLHQQLGIVNFAPLKPHFVSLFLGARATFSTTPGVPSTVMHLHRNLTEISSRAQGLPALCLALAGAIDRLKVAYSATTEGKFGDAAAHFSAVLHQVPLLVPQNKTEAAELRDLVGICREYLLGVRMEMARKDLVTANKDPARQLELAAYFTHCGVQSGHLQLVLRLAMVSAFKLKNFGTASSFARRLLELGPKPDVATQAKKAVQQFEATPTNELKLRYDERNPFSLCSISYLPIYKGSPLIKCPFCGASALPEHKGKLCNICQLSELGKEVSDRDSRL